MRSSTISDPSDCAFERGEEARRPIRQAAALQLLDTGAAPPLVARAMRLTTGELAALVRPARVRITGLRPWTAGARASAAAESYALGRLARGQSLTSVAAETGLAFELVRALGALS